MFAGQRRKFRRSNRRRHGALRRSIWLEALEPRLLLAVKTWSGDIPDGTVWNSGDIHHLTADVRVPAGARLDIEPGAVVKFGAYHFDLFVEGTLVANGTPAAPITFTEIRDDVGGDTNGDGSASAPSWDNWGRIEVQSTGSATLSHTVIRYGGYSSPGQLFVNGGNLTLRNSEVRYSRSSGVRIKSSDAVLTNNVYTDNYWAAVSMDLASNPQIAGVTVDKNGINGLYVDGGELGKNLSWNDPDIVYWLGSDITVPVGKTLTVAAGQVVKFGEYHYDLFVAGTLNVEGTAADACRIYRATGRRQE